MGFIDKNFLKGSFILLISFNLFNLLNFIFQFSMARILDVVEYGILTSLFSLIYIFGIFSESIQTIITKYSSGALSDGKLKSLLSKSTKKAGKASLVIFIIYSLIMIPLAGTINISYILLFFTGLVVFSSFTIPLTRGILQGKKMFKSLGVNLVSEAGIKILVSIFLVFLGWGIYGAISGVLFGAYASLFLSFLPLKKIFRSKKEDFKTTGIFQYGRPVFILTSSVILFLNLDVLLSRIVFSEEIAGAYAISSVLAKIIFFATYPISMAMFPISAGGRGRGQRNTFFNSLALLFIFIIVPLILFYLFPELIVELFSGKVLPASTSVLFYLGIGTGLLSIANLNILYKLSKGKTDKFYYVIFFILIEIFLLLYFSKDILQYSIAFITSSSVFLWGSLYILNK